MLRYLDPGADLNPFVTRLNTPAFLLFSFKGYFLIECFVLVILEGFLFGCSHIQFCISQKPTELQNTDQLSVDSVQQNIKKRALSFDFSEQLQTPGGENKAGLRGQHIVRLITIPVITPLRYLWSHSVVAMEGFQENFSRLPFFCGSSKKKHVHFFFAFPRVPLREIISKRS